MKTIFDKTNFVNLPIKNRIFRSAVWEGLTKNEHMTDELFRTYEELAKGGTGVIITSFVTVNPDDIPAPNMLGIYDDSFIEEYKKLTDMVHSYGAKIFIQLVAGGSQGRNNSNLGKTIYGPSAHVNPITGVEAVEMSKEKIDEVVQLFKDASARAKESGFDGVEIHAAHGYLISQFLNPLFNKREDEYGGDVDGRGRLLIDTYLSVREAVGDDFIVGMKINCDDFTDGGFNFGESSWICERMAMMGMDFIEISGGNAIRKVTSPEEESYFKAFANIIAEDNNIPVVLVGGNRDIDSIEEILNNSSIEYFAFARPLIREPNLANRWESGDRSRAKCISCNRCKGENGVSCIFNR